MKRMIMPEILGRGEKWTIKYVKEKTHGRTDILNHEMQIPEGDSEMEHYTRMHEMSHVKWSPDIREVAKLLPVEADRTAQYLLQMAEDGRINYLLLKSGVDVKAGFVEFYQKQADHVNLPHLTDVDLLKLNMFLAITTQAADPKLFREQIRSIRVADINLSAVLRRMLRIYRTHSNNFEQSTVPIVKLLLEYLNRKFKARVEHRELSEEDKKALFDFLINSFIKFIEKLIEEGKAIAAEAETPKDTPAIKIPASIAPPPKETPPIPKEELKEIQQELKSTFVDSGVKNDFVQEKLAQSEAVRQNMTDLWEGHFGEGDGVGAHWGGMEIQEVKRPVVISKKPGIRHVFSDSGGRIRRVDRDDVDGLMFTQQSRAYRKGSVLVDCSGSMNLEITDVERIIRACPGMTVAGYAGNDTEGWLRIFGKDGKMCNLDDLEFPNSHNTVDLPAVEWLAKQERPRFWVSDGRVVGAGSKYPKRLVDQVFDFILRHKILRVQNVSELENNCLKYRI